jgi:hypothetical protein
MYRRFALVVCLPAVALALTQLSQAAGSIQVIEPKTTISIGEKQTTVTLSIHNSTGRPITSTVAVNVLDPQDHVRGDGQVKVEAAPGTSRAVITIQQPRNTLLFEEKELIWYRLSYRVTTDGAPNASALSEGIISFSEIMPSLFDIIVSTPVRSRDSGQLRAQVTARHPITGLPARSISLIGKLTYDSDKKALTSTAKTDKNGFGVLDFNLPKDIGDNNDTTLEVTAEKGFEKHTVSGDIEFDNLQLAMLSTDKPIYQPGQTLHVRAILFNSINRALADVPVGLEISDPEGNTAFHTELKASRFGVVSADWPIPEGTRLGDYRLELSKTADDERNLGEATVKVSRYDLPNFKVEATPDHEFYLPGQNADIKVSAAYLFGQPVKQAAVRLVHEKERHWNYREQKYDTEESEVYTGILGDNDSFTAHVDLSNAHAELASSDYKRFEDITYAAYVTDPTTNRTEQSRFDLRVTRDPIHVYIVTTETSQNRNLPLDFYVSTTYADGSPAQCEVTIFDGPLHAEGVSSHHGVEPLRNVRTNRYGVAKVEGLQPPSTENSSYGERTLSFFALDRSGRKGQQENRFWRSNETGLSLKTDKTIYRPGEAIRSTIYGDGSEKSAIVVVSRDGRAILTRALSLQNGRATLTIPYTEELSGEISVTAFSDLDEDRTGSSRTVIYPHERELKVAVGMEKAEFRPGESAHASVSVKTSDGQPSESAVGVVVLDRAVEERAKTDSDFGSQYNFLNIYRRLAGYENSIGGLTIKDLNKLDPSQPVAPDLDFAAEVLLSSRGSGYWYSRVGEASYASNVEYLFRNLFANELYATRSRLNWRYLLTGEYPKDEVGLRAFLSSEGLNFGEVRDPWGTPFRASFSVERSNDITQLISAGPDKKFDTPDDIVAIRLSRDYFLPIKYSFEAALNDYHKRTRGFIRDVNALEDELLRKGLDLSALRDGWGQPYQVRFGVDNRYYTVSLESSGPNKRFEATDSAYDPDNFVIWTGRIDYFHEPEARIDAALQKFAESAKHFPADDAEFRKALQANDIDWNTVKDPWGRSFNVTFRQQSRFADHVEVKNVQVFGSTELQQRVEITPVTQTLRVIALYSTGEDGKPESGDDFFVTSFSHVESEQSAKDARPRSTSTISPNLTGVTGAITGTVRDLVGAAIPGATVKATLKNSSLEFTATTDDAGLYLLRNLPSGRYDLQISAPGFKVSLFQDVPVQFTTLTQVDSTLQVGAVSETVSITAEAITQLSTASSSVASIKETALSTNQRIKSAGPIILNQTSTPRLRKYFPETLVWLPSLQTDKRGKTSFDFKLADNITTWKMSVISSTEDGRVGLVEKDIRSFQPFFVDHEPPKILTEGDEISLPVVVRNYLEKSQQVGLEMKTEPWFTLLGPSNRSTQVPAGDSKRETFDFRATTSVKEGPQRVTAIAGDANDAIEKPVTVHPDGEETVSTASQVFSNTADLRVNIPANALPSARRGELKIYPNLLAHISEGIEGILERPHGCGEQTISSTYPNLLALRYLKDSDKDSGIAAKARKYLQEGYNRLLNYRSPDGGFSYWGHGEQADLALTAYALRFLSDARPFIEVDENMIKTARSWLISRQRPDGSWPARYYWSENEDNQRSIILTAYVARTLAMTEDVDVRKSASIPQDISKADEADSSRLAIKRALDLLAKKAEEIDEPYLIASYALAAFAAHDSRATAVAARIRGMAHEEGEAVYWSLETNTPFYGWGLAGRVETTALVTQVLVHDAEADGDMAAVETDKRLIDRALLFLLKRKDRYGVWYSTQATVNVFDTFAAIMAKDKATESIATPAGQAEVLINGNNAGTVAVPSDGKLSGPISIDVTRFLSNGDNVVEIRRGGQTSKASAQLLATYYMPWATSSAAALTNIRTGDSDALRLAVTFNKTEATVSDEINCHVEAERIGFHGYGMMLAEIGLPPGADVDRASIEHAMRDAGWGINQYDVLPDRLVVYLWPRAGGTKFDFKFKPRFGLKAKSAPSVLYDYYNPEAKTTVTPTSFVVR